MSAFICDSCIHMRVCYDNFQKYQAASKSFDGHCTSECAQYINVKNFTDAQQLKAEIAALIPVVTTHTPELGSPGIDWLIDKLRQLSAV